MFLLQFKLPVTVSHQLFADLHDKICANLIQGFQGVGRAFRVSGCTRAPMSFF